MTTVIKPDESGLSLLIPIISVIGMIGNATVLIVYLKKMRSVNSGGGAAGAGGRLTNIFIATLAMNDLVACVVVMPLTLVMELAPSLVFTTNYSCKLYYLFTASVIPFSAFLMTAISIDRYLCICQPLKTILTPLRARIVVVVLAVFAITMGTLVAIQYKATSVSAADYTDLDGSGVGFGNATTIATLFSANSTAANSRDSLYYTADVTNGQYNSSTYEDDYVVSASSPITSTGVAMWASGGCQTEPVLGVEFEQSYHYIHNTITFVVALALTFIFYALIYSRIWSRHMQKASRKAATSRALLQQGNSNPQIVITHQSLSIADGHSSQPTGPVSTASLELTPNSKTGVDCGPVDSSSESKRAIFSTGGDNNGNEEKPPLLNNNGFHQVPTADMELVDKSLLNETAIVSNNSSNNTSAAAVGTGVGDGSSSTAAASNSKPRASTTSLSAAGGAAKQSTSSDANSKQASFKLSGELGTQIRLAAMLFVVTVVFTLSYVPSFLANYTNLFGDPDQDPWNRFVFYIYFVNNAANPIIYGVMNRNFREDLRQLCCGHQTSSRFSGGAAARQTPVTRLRSANN